MRVKIRIFTLEEREKREAENRVPPSSLKQIFPVSLFFHSFFLLKTSPANLLTMSLSFS